jgi:hypothetical protein
MQVTAIGRRLIAVKKRKRGHPISSCSFVAGRGAEREFEHRWESGTPLTALEIVRGALVYTHQKRRVFPLPTAAKALCLSLITSLRTGMFG